MDIKELSNNAQIQVVLNIADLKELFLEWKEDNSRNANSEDEYMTADEVAIKYHVSKTTLWRNVKNGVWPAPIKVERKALYRKSDIDAVFNPSKQLPL